MAVAGDLEFFKGKAIHSDYLESDRLDRIAAQVQMNCVSKLWKLSLSCAVLNTVRHAQ